MRAYTREEHDAIVAAKGRPVTQGAIKRRKSDPDVVEFESVIDKYITTGRNK